MCTSSGTSTPSYKNYSLFNFYNVGNSELSNYGVKVTSKNSENLTLFEIDKSTNNILVGTFDISSVGGTVKVGGCDLQLYSSTSFKLKSLY
jgi:hypothetical protein